MKDKNCLTDKEIAFYVCKVLNENERQKIEEHLADCPICLQKVVVLYERFNKNKPKICQKIRELLPKYIKAKKSMRIEPEIEMIETHLMFCQECFDFWYKLYEKEITEEPSLTNKIKEYFDVILGAVTNFPALSPLLPSIQAKALAKIKETEVKDYQEINLAGIKAILTLDMNDNLWVKLKSEKYEINNIKVELCRREGESYVSIKSATTNNEGMANLGKIEEIKRPYYEYYFLRLPEVKQVEK